MRSATILLAVALGVSAAPVPVKVQHEKVERAPVPAPVVQSDYVWKHRHFDSARESQKRAPAPAKRSPTPWQHKHYETASKPVAKRQPVQTQAPWQHKHYETASKPVEKRQPVQTQAPWQHKHFDAAVKSAVVKRQEAHTASVRAFWANRQFEVDPASAPAEIPAPISSASLPGTTATASLPGTTISASLPGTASAPAETGHGGHHGHGEHSHGGPDHTRTRDGSHHTHSGSHAHTHTRGGEHHADNAGAAPTGVPGTFPDQAPCWRYPDFPLPSGPNATPTSWEWSTSWTLPTGVPADGKAWPFPWPPCPQEPKDGADPAPPSFPLPTEIPLPFPTEAPAPPEPKPTEAPAPAPEPQPTEAPAPGEPAPAPEPEPIEAPAPAPPSGPSDGDAQAYLEAHNTARAQYHANPLAWSDELAALAKQWTAGCKFAHSDGSLSSIAYGENLAAGSGDYKPADGVAGWVAEAPEYNPSNPIPSHFTQVVWKSSTEVGCAWTECPAGSIFDASYGPAKFHSCMYGPPGNYVGDFANNVEV